jgi:ATP-dependent RNA helicase DeaD
MPAQVRRIAQNHLRKPAEVTIRSKTSTASSIRQRFWMVSGMHKLDALTRILEAETFDAMLVFARTKQATAELAERLEARGFAVEALNGDIPQPLRERTIARLKAGQIDIVVATDVAARGLDVERISHVVNFDVPYDPESYVHRIGRTGRAGRSGEAILFIAPRERNMLRVIERATRQPITQMQLPTVEDVNEQRVNRFNQRITDVLASGEADAFRGLIERYEQERNVPAIEIAAALASLAQGKTPLFLETSRREAPDREQRPERAPVEKSERKREREPEHRREREGERAEATRPPPRHERRDREERPAPREFSSERAPGKHRERIDDESLQTYRIEVGEIHGIKPANIVGAIANEAGIEGKFIGRVVIREDHSFVDLPGGMPKEVFRSLQKVRVGGQQLQISLALKTQTERLKREHVPARKPFEKKGPPKAHKAHKPRK